MNLAETMTNQQPTKRQRDIYQQVQQHAPVDENTLNFYPVHLRDSTNEEYLVAQTELKTVTHKPLWLTSSLPQFSNHIFISLNEQDPGLMRGLVARLDAQSEVNDKIRAGFFGGINLQVFNQQGWYGFFIVPINKWLTQFPTTVTNFDAYDNSIEKSHYSLIVLLTKNELEFARQNGNRKLYQHLKKSRQTPYYINTKNNIEALSQLDSTAKHSKRPLNQDPSRQDILQRTKPIKQASYSNAEVEVEKQKTYQNDGSTQDISLEVHESEFPLIPPHSSIRKKITQHDSSNLSAYQRLKNDLRTEIQKNSPESSEKDRANKMTNTSSLFSLAATTLAKFWPKLTLNTIPITQQQERLIPRIPLKLQIIGETLSGGSFAIGGFIFSIFLIGKGHISASLFSALFTCAGVLMLNDAYRMSKRINNN